MVEPESTQSSDAPDGAPAAPIYDWTNVRGFQVLAATGLDSVAPATEPDAHTALTKELGVRAARFSQSVDDSIVLANDGLIRWLGDPVARLIAGDDLLRPKVVPLADEALSAEALELVQTRLGLWISAHVSKVLGPLEALAEPGAVAEPVRALANRIAQALGVLERERVRQQVKNLDQSARSALRKLGVRFGSMYIFVPALLKPGARTLCSQLWGLRRGEAGAERLLAFAAAGRTSFAAEAPLAADTYRVAGFRLCGDRVVRIDIIERLNDLIRAAIPDHMRPGGRAVSEASGFVVSPQMTSLTGCAGESFASILRSLGYESHRVRKSEFEAAMRRVTAPTNPIGAPTVAAHPEVDHSASAGADEAAEAADETEAASPQQSAAGDAANPIEAVEPATPSPELEPGFVEAAEPEQGSDADESAPAEAIALATPEPPSLEPEPEPGFVGTADPVQASGIAKSAPADAAELAPPTTPSPGQEPGFVTAADPRRPSDIAESDQANLVEAAAPPTSSPDPEPGLVPLDAEAPVVAESASGDADEASIDPAEQGERPSVEIVESSPGPPPAEDEWIEVWRPAPRRRPQPTPRPIASAPAPASDVDARPPRHTRDARRRWQRDPVAGPDAGGQDARNQSPTTATAETPAAAANEGPREPRRHEGGAPHRAERGRRHSHKGPRPEETREPDTTRGAKDTSSAPGKKEYRPAQVDLNSPFAKLLALKPLLERRDKRT